MTFEEFQATRTACADLGKALDDARWDGETPGTGFTYAGTLYIENFSPAADGAPRYWLTLHRDEYIDRDITVLERRLYDWACDEGYFDE